MMAGGVAGLLPAQRRREGKPRRTGTGRLARAAMWLASGAMVVYLAADGLRLAPAGRLAREAAGPGPGQDWGRRQPFHHRPGVEAGSSNYGGGGSGSGGAAVAAEGIPERGVGAREPAGGGEGIEGPGPSKLALERKKVLDAADPGTAAAAAAPEDAEAAAGLQAALEEAQARDTRLKVVGHRSRKRKAHKSRGSAGGAASMGLRSSWGSLGKGERRGCPALENRFRILEDGTVGQASEASVQDALNTWELGQSYPERLQIVGAAKFATWTPDQDGAEILIAVWEGLAQDDDGKPLDPRAKASQKNFYWANSLDHGETWAQARPLPTQHHRPIHQPVLLADGKVLTLFYTQSKSCKGKDGQYPEGGNVYMMQLLGLNRRWSSPKMVKEGRYVADGPYRIGPAALRSMDGTWKLPVWENLVSAVDGCAVEGDAPQTRLRLMTSRDKGATWSAEGVLKLDGTFKHFAVVEFPPPKSVRKMVKWGILVAVFQGADGCMYRVESHTRGKTWDAPKEVGLPASLVPHWMAKNEDGRLFLAFNNHGLQGPNCRACVSMLSVAVSEDSGASWRLGGVIDDGVQDGVLIGHPSISSLNRTHLQLAYVISPVGDEVLKGEGFGLYLTTVALKPGQDKRTEPAEHTEMECLMAYEKFAQHMFGKMEAPEKRSYEKLSWTLLTKHVAAEYDLKPWGGLQGLAASLDARAAFQGAMTGTSLGEVDEVRYDAPRGDAAEEGELTAGWQDGGVCAAMPCCEDYGAHCTKIPKCPQQCASRPCCA